jgi:hypothetical protein
VVFLVAAHGASGVGFFGHFEGVGFGTVGAVVALGGHFVALLKSGKKVEWPGGGKGDASAARSLKMGRNGSGIARCEHRVRCGDG